MEIYISNCQQFSKVNFIIEHKITFQMSKLISNCPPPYEEVGEIAAPIAILLLV